MFRNSTESAKLRIGPVLERKKYLGCSLTVVNKITNITKRCTMQCFKSKNQDLKIYSKNQSVASAAHVERACGYICVFGAHLF